MSKGTGQPRLLRAGDGEVRGAIEGVRDRFMIDARDTESRFSMLQHLMPAKALAAPWHLHTREDEYSFVLEGRMGALLGEDEVFAEAGDLVFKPRGQWHTFWNAGDKPAVILEIISPGGLEDAFRAMEELGDEVTPEALDKIIRPYGAEADFERTMAIIEQYGLTF